MTEITFASFLTLAGDALTLVTDGIGIFMEPPLVWFVALGAAAAGVGMAKTLIPRKRAK